MGARSQQTLRIEVPNRTIPAMDRVEGPEAAWPCQPGLTGCASDLLSPLLSPLSLPARSGCAAEGVGEDSDSHLLRKL